jgi:GDP-L-fucose synthase
VARDFLAGETVLVTGGAGLVGSAFVEALLAKGARVRTVRHIRPVPNWDDVEVLDGDLRDADTCRRVCAGVGAVVHAAGVSGGSRNVTTHGIEMFTDTLLMSTQVLEAARLEEVPRYLFISNSSVYAKSEEPLTEDDAWGETMRGTPENETGTVKRAGEAQCGLYARFTAMRIGIARGANTYGPHDNFDLQTSHVVPALIRKAVERQQPFRLWGSGETVRDFIFSRDLAEGGLAVLEAAVEGSCRPVNLGSGQTVSIRELAGVVLEEAGYTNAHIELEPDAPPASPAKRLALARMRGVGFSPEVTLPDGIARTIGWYRERSR